MNLKRERYLSIWRNWLDDNQGNIAFIGIAIIYLIWSWVLAGKNYN